ncbi:MAG: hypothetical protein N3A53_01900 [Verrucomicrobiae bacterium]|nr:hypothetical protein [Verrucomicrobiae bacterium]
MIKLRISAIKAQASHRPRGYVDDVLSRGKVQGDWLHIEPEDYWELRRKYGAKAAVQKRWLWLARLISKLRRPRDRGVGDTIERIIRPVGGQAYKELHRFVTGKPCRCAHRQAKLNSAFPYTQTKQ